MDLRAHHSKGLWRRIRAPTVNVPIADVVFEVLAFQVKAPSTKLGSIQGEFQPVIRVLECCLLLPPLREQRGEDERAG